VTSAIRTRRHLEPSLGTGKMSFIEVEAIKPIERLVRLSWTHCCAYTCRLSTWWSSTALKRDLVLRWVSRLDAFSGYPVHTIATRLRGWRHDRSTRGMSIPVLSY